MTTRLGQDAYLKAVHARKAAQKALDGIQEAESTFDAILCWENFVSGWCKAQKNICAALSHGGAKKSADHFKSILKSDPAIEYVFQSRNSDEHSPEFIVDYSPEKVMIGDHKTPNLFELSTSGTSYFANNYVVERGIDGKTRYNELPTVNIVGGTITSRKHNGYGEVQVSSARLILSEITTRDGRRLLPPTIVGSKEPSAKDIGEYVLASIDTLISEYGA